jgi:hypothetical protein
VPPCPLNCRYRVQSGQDLLSVSFFSLTDAVEKVGGMSRARNNRIMDVDFLNRDCFSDPEHPETSTTAVCAFLRTCFEAVKDPLGNEIQLESLRVRVSMGQNPIFVPFMMFPIPRRFPTRSFETFADPPRLCDRVCVRAARHVVELPDDLFIYKHLRQAG